ncbi:unnamed protein product [Porites lobata]|uniref:Nudix hydrolase domain-containing protein n=1 Tax=Porites lobata TaxID=104759 RepID=A0ABN8P7H9_9CNID|nr:unnamed protein product [Porites lobata]
MTSPEELSGKTAVLCAEGYLESSQIQDADSNTFTGIRDIFGGITINTEKETCKGEKEFETKLVSSLEKFKQGAIRGVWLRISIKNSTYIPIAVKHGFVFHHTYPHHIVMTQWLPKTEPNTLPTFATSYLGAGGLVINEKNQVLAVCEKYRRKQHWKLPGGMVDRDESIIEAVKREVFEETGIETEFVSLVCFRHLVNFRFGCSDVYFICHLRPLTQEIKMDTKEIAAAQWMDLDEYIASPLVNDSNRFIAESYKNSFQNNDSVLKIEAKQIQVGKATATFFSLNQNNLQSTL